MTTFDDVLPRLAKILAHHLDTLNRIRPVYVNRDLNGRIRLIVDEKWRDISECKTVLDDIVKSMYDSLSPHAYPPEHAVLWETDPDALLSGQTSFPLETCPDIRVVDRLAVEGDWAHIAPVSTATPRVVFFSIKGGVGRSSALAAVAWALAEQGKRVLVLDLDLESPGLSTSLLPDDRRPTKGIADWLVEDLVDNGDAVLDDMWAASTLSREGDISVVPAHGGDPGEYIAKLGRVWMPKLDANGRREAWPERLRRLLHVLEEKLKPDAVLIDSRAGIDEVASACITSLGASLILLFAFDGDQTWSGYRIIFQHWLKTNSVRMIRERLQVVGAMVPEIGGADYLEGLRDSAWNAFVEKLYDEVPAGAEPALADSWSFDQGDESAPHAPWPIRWNRGFAAVRSLHDRLDGIDRQEIMSVFGPLIDGVTRMTILEHDAV